MQSYGRRRRLLIRLYIRVGVEMASEKDKCSSEFTDTGEPVFLPFRMSCFVLSNLVVTAGMLTPGLQVSLIYIQKKSIANCIQQRQPARSYGKSPINPSMLLLTTRTQINLPRYPSQRSHNHTFWLLVLRVQLH